MAADWGYGGDTSLWRCKACAFGNNDLMPYCEYCGVEKGKTLPAVPDNTSIKTAGAEADPAAALAHRMRKMLYSADNVFSHHLEALGAHREAYFAEINSRLDNSIEIADAIRARVLAATWGAGETDAFDDLLAEHGFTNVAVLAKALALLDGNRAAKALRRKMNRSALQRRVTKGHLPAMLLSKQDKVRAAREEVALTPAAPVSAYGTSALEDYEAALEWGQVHPSFSSSHARSGAAASLAAGLATGEAVWRAAATTTAHVAPGDDDAGTTTARHFLSPEMRPAMAAASLGRPGAAPALLAGLAPEADGVVTMQPPTAAYTAAARERHHILVEASENCRGVTSSLAKRVRRWVAAVPRARLEFLLLKLSAPDMDGFAALSPWRTVMDLAHVNPSSLSLPYFAQVVHKGFDQVPADSFVAALLSVTAGNLPALAASQPRVREMYSFVHHSVPPAVMSGDMKTWFATHAPLGEVLWWYEELHCPGAEAAVMGRLSTPSVDISEGQYDMNFGKLMERYLEFTSRGYAFASLLGPRAEACLATLAAASPKRGLRVAVLGDASGSMEVAVRTASILGSLLSVVLDAKLDFFDTEVRPSPLQPRTAADVLTVSTGTPAAGATTPAAGMRKYLDAGTPVDLFVLVTDEGENGTSGGSNFAQLFRQYKANVHAGARVFFVSFLPTNVTMGPMQVSLAQVGVPSSCFRLDGNRPDLTKLSSLLGQLYTLTEEFDTVAPSTASSAAPVNKAAPGGSGDPPTSKSHPAEATPPGAAAGGAGAVTSDAYGAATLLRGGRAIGKPRPAGTAAPTAPRLTAAAAGGGGGSAPPSQNDDVPVDAAEAEAGDDDEPSAPTAVPPSVPERQASSGDVEVTGPYTTTAAAAATDVSALMARLAALEAENAALRSK